MFRQASTFLLLGRRQLTTVKASSPSPLRHSSTSSPLRSFMVHVPDFPNTGEQRSSARDAHLKEVEPLIEEGRLLFWAVTLTGQSTPSGSFMLVKAKSEDEIKQMLETDAYTKAGAWNIERASIWEVNYGFRPEG